MPVHKRYLLDSDVFIQAQRQYYRFKLCPGFWDCLLWHCKQGTVVSIDKVRKEIEIGKDDLADWIKDACPKRFFEPTSDSEVTNQYGQMVSWVQNKPQYLPEAKAEFAASADGWLAAYAKQNDRIVVTREVSAPESRKAVKIPDLCRAFKVPCIDTFDMLGDLQIEFTWDPASVVAR